MIRATVTLMTRDVYDKILNHYSTSRHFFDSKKVNIICLCPQQPQCIYSLPPKINYGKVKYTSSVPQSLKVTEEIVDHEINYWQLFNTIIPGSFAMTSQCNSNLHILHVKSIYRLQTLWLIIFIFLYALPAGAEQQDNWAARIVSLKGNVKVQSEQEGTWNPARYDQILGFESTIRVGRLGKATVLLPNETICTIGEKSSVSFPQKDNSDNYRHIKINYGKVKCTSSVPQSMKVHTDIVNAKIDYTEFLVKVEKEKKKYIPYISLSFPARCPCQTSTAGLSLPTARPLSRSGEAPQPSTPLSNMRTRFSGPCTILG